MKKITYFILLFIIISISLNACSAKNYSTSRTRESKNSYTTNFTLSEIFPTGIYTDQYHLDSLYLEEIGENSIKFLLDSQKPNSSLYSYTDTLTVKLDGYKTVPFEYTSSTGHTSRSIIFFFPESKSIFMETETNLNTDNGFSVTINGELNYSNPLPKDYHSDYFEGDAPYPNPNNYFLSVGNSGTLNGIRTTLVSAKKITDSKKSYVFIEWEFSNVSNNDSYVESIEAYLDDYKVESTFLFGEYSTNSKIFTSLSPGKKVKASTVYQLPDDWNTLEILYHSSFGDEYIQFFLFPPSID